MAQIRTRLTRCSLAALLGLCVVVAMGAFPSAAVGHAVQDGAEQAGPESPPTVRFNFKDARWTDVIDYLARSTPKEVVREVDPPDATVDFVSGTSFELPEAIEVLNKLLFRHKLAILDQGDFFVLTSHGQAAARGEKFFDEIDPSVGDVSIVTLVIPLNYATASDIAPRVEKLLTPELGSVSAMAQQNFLVVQDTAAQARLIRRVVSDMDNRPPGVSNQLYQLVHSDPQRVAKILEETLGGYPKIMSEDKNKRIYVVDDVTKPRTSFRPAPDANAVIGVGDPAKLSAAADMIRMLDSPDGGSGEQVVSSVDVFAMTPSQASQRIGGLFQALPAPRRPQIIPLDEQGKVTMVGTASQIALARELLESIDPGAGQSGTGRPVFVARTVELEHADAGAVLRFLPNVLSPRQRAALRTAALPDGASVLIAGAERDVEHAMSAIAAIDTPAKVRLETRQTRIAAGDPAAVYEEAKRLVALTEPDESLRVQTVFDERTSLVTIIGGRQGIDLFVRTLEQARAAAGPVIERRVYSIQEAPVRDLATRLSRSAAALLRPADGTPFVAPRFEAVQELSRLIVHAQPEHFAAIDELLGEIQAELTAERVTRTFTLASARPSQMGPRLTSLARTMLRDPTDDAVFHEPLVQAVDELGTLIVHATGEQMRVIEQLVETLDRPGPDDRVFQIVRLRQLAGASEQLTRARALYDEQTQGMAASDAGRIEAEIDEASGTMQLRGSSRGVARFTQLFNQLAQLTPPQRSTELIEVRQAKAESVAAKLTELMAAVGDTDPARRVDPPEIAAIASTNSLLVTAEPAQMRMVRDFAARLDRIEPEDLPPLRFLQVRSADAVGVSRMLREHFSRRPAEERRSRPVDVQADQATNTLIVSAHEELYKEIESLVEQFGRTRDTTGRQTEIFQLNAARAEDVAAAMQKLYPEPPIPLDSRGRPMPWARGQREVTVSANPSSNSLIIDAPVERMDAFKALAEKLDRVEAPPAAELRTYKIVRADLGAIQSTLRSLAQQGNLSKPAESGRQRIQVLVEAEPQSSTLIVAGDEVTFARVEQMLAELEAVPVERPLRIVPIANADAADVRDRAQAIYDAQVAQNPNAEQVAVTVDEANNALQIVADDESMRRYLRILDELQRQAGPPKQVRMLQMQFAQAEDVVAFLRDLAQSSRSFTVRGGAEPVFEVIEENNSILVAAQPDQLPIIEQLVSSVDQRGEMERPPLRILKLRTTEATGIAEMLNRQFSRRAPDERARKPVDITADGMTNTLIVSAHPDMYSQIEAIVTELNESRGLDDEGREIRIFPLRVARAENLARTLDEMFPQPPAPRDRRGNPLPELQPQPEVIVRAEPATNALIVDAPVQRMAGFEQLVRQLDQQQAPENVELRTYTVARADLASVQQTLRRAAENGSLTQGLPSSRANAKTAITVDTEPMSRSLIISGPVEIFVEVERILAALDAPPDRAATSLRMYALTHARAERLAPILQRLLLTRIEEARDAGEFGKADPESLLDVSAEPATNTLIVSAPEAIREIADLLVETLDTPRASVGRPVVRVLPLTYADASQTAGTLNSAIPTLDLPTGGRVRVSSAAGSNALILAGAQDDLKVVEALIEELDVRPMSEDAISVETFTLEHAEAQQIAQTVQRLLVEQQQTDPRILQMQLRYSRGQLPNIPQVRVEVDGRTNSLIVSGPAATIELARSVIDRLDAPSEAPDREISVFSPARAEADRLVASAQPILDRTLERRRRPLTLRAEPATGSVVIEGPGDQIEDARAVLERIDHEAVVAPAMTLRVFDLAHTEAGAVAATVQAMLRDRSRWPEQLRRASQLGLMSVEPTVSADPAGNRLVVSAPTMLDALAMQLIAAFDSEPTRGVTDTRVFALEKADAESVARAIGEAFAQPGTVGGARVSVTAETSGNSVVVTASPEALERVTEIVASLDRVGGADGVAVRTVVLKHARAEALAPTIETLMTRPPQIPSGTPWWMINQLNATMQSADSVKVASDARLNAIVLTGPPAALEIAEQMIAGLDVEDRATAQTVFKTIPLRNTDGQEIAAAVEDLFAEGEDAPPVVRVVSEGTVLFVRATPDQLTTIETFVSDLDAATLSASKEMRRIPLDPSRASAGEMARLLQQLLREQRGAKVQVLGLDELMEEPEERPATEPGSRAAPARMPSVLEGLAFAVFAMTPQDEQAEGDEEGDEPDVTIAIDPATNSLIVIGASKLAERIETLARELEQQMPADPRRVRVITLPESADARGLANVVNQTVRQLGRFSQTNPGGLSGPVSIVADPAGQSLVIAAADADFEVVRQVIGAVARPGATQELTVKVYALTNLNAQRAQRAIMDLMSASPRGRQAQRVREQALTLSDADGTGRRVEFDPGLVRIATDPAGSSLIVAAPAAAFEFIDRFVELIDQAPVSDRLAIRSFRLSHASSTATAQQLQRMFNAVRQGRSTGDVPRPQFVGDDRTNTLLVTASPKQLTEVERLLGTLDIPGGAEAAGAELIPLQTARARDVVNVIRDVIIGRDRTRRDEIRVSASDDANALFVRAPEEDMAEIRSLVEQLDSVGDTGLPLHAIKLERANAREVADALARFFRDRDRAQGRRGDGGIAISGDQRTSTLLVAANDEDLAQVRSLLETFDAPTAKQNVQFRIIRLENANVGDLEETLDDMRWQIVEQPRWRGRGGTDEAPLSIAYDQRANAVILSGAGDSFDFFEGLIKELDQPGDAETEQTVAIARLENADPRTISNAVSQAMQTPGWQWWRGQDPNGVSITVDRVSGSLVLIGRGDRVEQAKAYIASLDEAAGGEGRQVESVALRFADAAQLAGLLNRFFRDGGAGAAAVQIIGAPRGRTLVVTAEADDLATVRSLVAEFDKPSEGEQQRELIRLRNAEAQAVSQVIGQQFPDRADRVIVTPLVERNSLIVAAPAELFVRVRETIDLLDAAPNADDAKITTVTLKNARADGVAQSLVSALPEGIRVKITPDVRSNSLLLTGSDEAVALVVEQITQLDSERVVSPVEFRIVYLTHQMADDLWFTVRAMVRGLPTDDTAEPPAIDYLSDKNALTVSAAGDQMEQILSIIDQLDQPTVAGQTREFVPLEFADAEQTAEALSAFYGPRALLAETPGAQRVTIFAVPVTNSLVIQADDSEWEGIRALLTEIDREEYDTDRRLEIITLDHADAQSLARSLNEAFQAPQRAALERERARRQNEPRRNNNTDSSRRDDPDVNPVIIAADDTVSVAAEVRSNSLIVSASREDLEKIRRIVERVDVPGFERLPEPRVIALQRGPASSVAESLRAFFRDVEQRGQQGTRSTVIIGDDRANVLIVRAEEPVFARIRALAETLQTEGAGEWATVRVLRLEGTSAARLASTVQATFTPVAQQRGQTLSVQVDRANNALIISSSKSVYEEIERVVRELDSAPPDQINAAPGRAVEIIDIVHNTPQRVLQTLNQLGVSRPVAAQEPSLLSEPAQLFTLSTRRAIVAVVAPRDAAALRNIVSAIDAEPVGAEQSVAIVMLREADSETVAASLRQMLAPGEGAIGAAPAQALIEQVRRLSVQREGADGEDIELDLATPVRIVSERQLNAVVISGSTTNVAALRGVVSMLDRLPIGQAVTVRIIPLENASAERVAAVLRGLFDQASDLLQAGGGRQGAVESPTQVGRALSGELAVEVDSRTNALVVAGREEAVALVEVLVDEMDSGTMANWLEPTIITLEHADAQDVARLLNSALVQGIEDTPEAEAIRRQVGRLRTTDDIAQATDIFGSLQSLVIEPEPQLNAILAVGTPANLEAVRSLVGMLDVPRASAANRVRLFPLESASADSIEQTLREIFDQQVRAGVFREEDSLVISSYLRTNTLVISTSPRGFTIVEELVARLDGDRADPAVQMHIAQAEGLDVAELAPKLETAVRERINSASRDGQDRSPSDAFSVQALPGSNSFLVTASRENFELVTSLIESLQEGQALPGADAGIEFFTLRSTDPETIVDQLEALYIQREIAKRGPDALSVTGDERLNAVIVRGTPADIEAIGQFVERLDQEQVALVAEVKRIELKNDDATDIVSQLGDALGSGNVGSGRSGQAQVKRLTIPPANDGGAPETVEAEFSPAILDQISLGADTRTNSVTITAPPDQMRFIEAWITERDRSRAGERIIESFRLANADALQMAALLRDLFSLEETGRGSFVLVPGRGPEDEETGEGSLFAVPDERQKLSITVDQRTNSLMVSATREYLERVRDVVMKLDSIEANERDQLVYELKNARALEVAQTLQEYFRNQAQLRREILGGDRSDSVLRQLEREVIVQGDEKSNRLIVSISPRFRETVDNIIGELDSTPPQVLIQVLLAEVTLDSSEEWGLDFNINEIGGDLYNVAALAASAGVTTSLGVPNLSVSSTDFDILVRALEVQGRLEVLSRPQILVNNNEPARIQVGDSVRLAANQERRTDGSVSTQIEVEETGIILDVTPAISSDGFVRMDITPEISSITSRTTQISEDFQAPIISRRLVSTNVTVRDGETVVIGGLIQSTDEQRKTKVPILGDLPGLGIIFRSIDFREQKTELLVLLRPRVIRTSSSLGADAMREVTESELDRLSQPESIRDIFAVPEGNEALPPERPTPTEPTRSAPTSGEAVVEPKDDPDSTRGEVYRGPRRFNRGGAQ